MICAASEAFHSGLNISAKNYVKGEINLMFTVVQFPWSHRISPYKNKVTR